MSVAFMGRNCLQPSVGAGCGIIFFRYWFWYWILLGYIQIAILMYQNQIMIDQIFIGQALRLHNNVLMHQQWQGALDNIFFLSCKRLTIKYLGSIPISEARGSLIEK